MRRGVPAGAFLTAEPTGLQRLDERHAAGWVAYDGDAEPAAPGIEYAVPCVIAVIAADLERGECRQDCRLICLEPVRVKVPPGVVMLCGRVIV